MLMIRLQRMGKKKQPTYRLIVSEKSKDPQGRNLEILGQYNPLAKPKVIAFKNDRVLYWMGKGAQPSETVHNLLVKTGVVVGKKKQVVHISKRRQAKAAKAAA